MKTETVVRVEEGSYWEVETCMDGARTTYTVRHDGWVVGECYHGSAGWRSSRAPSEKVPDKVLDLLPDFAMAALLRGPTP